MSKRVAHTTFWPRMLFIIVPLLVAAFFLFQLSGKYLMIDNPGFINTQYACWCAGVLISAVLFQKKLRAVPAIAFNLILIWLLYLFFDHYVQVEFISFFVTFRLLFYLAGFITGWLLSGQKPLQYIFSGILLLLAILFSVKLFSGDVLKMGIIIVTAIIAVLYLLYINEVLYNHEDNRPFPWSSTLFRSLLYIAGITVLPLSLWLLYTPSIKKAVSNYYHNEDAGGQGMTHKNPDGTVGLNKSTSLSGSQRRGKMLVFVAHIKNYFPTDSLPNPLYLTEYYYTKFNPGTQTFEIDPNMPGQDRFSPNPAQIPLYKKLTDSNVIRKESNLKLKKVVNIEVYKTNMGDNEFVAPSTAFSVQPIAPGTDYIKQYRSAYRAQSFVSELNSAYLIYNTTNRDIRNFQEQRYILLRQAADYHQMPDNLYRYYTQIPDGPDFQKIKNLALQITKGKKTPLEKILAIRDYFNGKDSSGKPLFAYSDNPGEPDIPNANKLNYFLFQSRKGYCAYYAGATLFMLRAAGVPSRIAAGYMTVDRSTKNKGWYWYYQDQAHAWVEIYFPGFGWLDFDTTVGNEASESPTPDGTPPEQPNDATFSGEGIIIVKDPIKEQITVQLKNFVLKNNSIDGHNQAVIMSLKGAVITKDTNAIRFTDIRTGDSATAISFNTNNAGNRYGHDTDDIKQLPSPLHIDELRIKASQAEKHALARKNEPAGNHKRIWIAVGIITAFIFSLLFLYIFRHWLRYHYYAFKMRLSSGMALKSYYTEKCMHLLLSRLGHPQQPGETLQQFADRVYRDTGISIQAFTQQYIRLKYAPSGEHTAATDPAGYLKQFENDIRSHYSRKDIYKAFLTHSFI